MAHPDDDNGNVLRRMEAKGDTLTRPRNIDFNVVFPNQLSAEQFAERSREQGYGVSEEGYESEEEFPWEVSTAYFLRGRTGARGQPRRSIRAARPWRAAPALGAKRRALTDDGAEVIPPQTLKGRRLAAV